jgi:hypothetical protein
MGAGKNFHEGGFACAVFAHEGEYFAWADGEVDATEGEGGAEAFVDTGHLEDDRGGGGGGGHGKVQLWKMEEPQMKAEDALVTTSGMAMVWG